MYNPIPYTLWGHPHTLQRVSKPQAQCSAGCQVVLGHLEPCYWLVAAWLSSGKVGTLFPLVLWLWPMRAKFGAYHHHLFWFGSEHSCH